ncbi:UNVERIFIED_CONTAM: NEDD4-binding protein 2 [Siphonaria sp. JEL0065]|nr:NEDD4-binding protein 2 [Siphonaria sp. JEL0065]
MTATSYTLLLVRGCSGSGKSTLVKQIVSDSTVSPIAVFSTDDFWLTKTILPDGTETTEYKHDISKLSEAHRWNQQRATLAMETKSHPLVIIDNTNLQRWEAKPYVECAVRCGYEVQVREPTTSWWVAKDVEELFKRGTHGVPLDAITRMVERYEPDFSVEAILQSSPPVFNNNNRGGKRGGFNNGGNRGGFNNGGNRGGFNNGGNRGGFNNNRGGFNGNNDTNAFNVNNNKVVNNNNGTTPVNSVVPNSSQ